MITIAHKVELLPNNKQKTCIKKAIGCARLAWNWGLEEWKRQYKEGENPSAYSLRKKFNSIKKEQYPFVCEVTVHATGHPFIELQKAFERFFKKIANYPKPKKKKDRKGSFYYGGYSVRVTDVNTNSKAYRTLHDNESSSRQYLVIQRIGCVKMAERLRFSGKISNVVISQRGDRYFASFSMMITEEEYYRTHPNVKSQNKGVVGIDLGLKSSMVLSDGVSVNNPKFIYNDDKKLKKLERQLSKRVHPKNKHEIAAGIVRSNNYRKLSLRLGNAMHKVSDARHDFIDKVTTILTTHYSDIVLETLMVNNMVKNHYIARSVYDAGLFMFQRRIEMKAANNGVRVHRASMWYPSSKMCSKCGHVVKRLLMNQRTYKCECCGEVIDRDMNAALNLRTIINNNIIGKDQSEFTPVDLKALLSAFDRNRIATSKIETGMHQNMLIKQCL